MSANARGGNAGICSARIVVVAFAEDDLVEVFALVIQAAGVLSTFVGYEILWDCLGAGNHLSGFQIDAVAAVVAPLAAIWGRYLGDGAAARFATGPVATVAQGSAATYFFEVVLRATNSVSTGAGSIVTGVRGLTGSAFSEATIIAALFRLAIWGTFALVGFAVEGGLTFGANPTAPIVPTLLAGAGWFTDTKTTLADFLGPLTLAAATATAIGTAPILKALWLADLNYDIR